MSQLNTDKTRIKRSATMRRLSLTTALTGLALVGYGRGAYAGSCSGAGGTYLCADPGDPATDTAITITSSGPVEVTTEDGFGVDTSSDPDATALEVLSEYGADISTGSDVSITAYETPADPNTAGALYIRNDYGGIVTVDTSGATLRGQNGMSVLNAYYGYSDPAVADVLVTTGETRATSGTALRAINRGDGVDGADLIIDSTAGETSSGTGVGLDAEGAGFAAYGYADLVVTTGDVSGGAGAIRALSEADGFYGADVVIDTTAGTVSSSGGRGIEAVHDGYSLAGSTDLAITTAGVTGATDGIRTYSGATGYEYSDVFIDSTAGSVTGTSGIGIDATQNAYSQDGTADLVISTADVTGGEGGIRARAEAYGSYGSDVIIDSSAGAVIGQSGIGIDVRSANETYDGASDLFVTTGDVTGGVTGIDARSDATGTGDSVLSINTTAGSVLGEAGQGIRAVSGAQSSEGVVDLAITTADVTASAVVPDPPGIVPASDHAERSAYSAITAQTTGSGGLAANLTIDTSAGRVDSTSGMGIVVDSSATSATGRAGLFITTGDVAARERGISAHQSATGADGATLNVDTTAGAVTTDQGNGIYARSDAQSSDGSVDVTIHTGDITSVSPYLNTISTPGEFDVQPNLAAAVTAVSFGAGATGASVTVDTTAGTLDTGVGHGVYAGSRAMSSAGRADLTISTGDIRISHVATNGVRARQEGTGALGADLTIDTTAGTIADLNTRPGPLANTSIGIDAQHTGSSSGGSAATHVRTGDVISGGVGAVRVVSVAQARDDASLTLDTTAGDIVLDAATGSFVSGVFVNNGAQSTTADAETTLRTGDVTATNSISSGRISAIKMDSGAVAEGSVDMLLDTTAGYLSAYSQVTGRAERTSRSGSANITVLTGAFDRDVTVRNDSTAATDATITMDTTAGVGLDDGRGGQARIRNDAQAGGTADIRGTFGDLGGRSEFFQDSLNVIHRGSGATGANTILDTTAGTLDGASAYGANVDHYGTAAYGTADLVITTADVTGGAGGMRIVAGADGYYGADVTIDSSAGAVTGQTAPGIYATQKGYSGYGTTDLSITTADVTGATDGIRALGDGYSYYDSDLRIDTSAGSVIGTSGAGIDANHTASTIQGETALVITTANVTGGTDGIRVRGEARGNAGSDMTIDSSAGAVIGQSGIGIDMRSANENPDGTSDVTIATGDVTGGTTGIDARSDAKGTGDSLLIIDTTAGSVLGEAGQGIRATNTAQSAEGAVGVRITTADVRASAVASEPLEVEDFADHAGRSRYGGVTAQMTGTGETGASMAIDTSGGVVASTSRMGIVAENRGTSVNDAADLSITTGDVEGAVRGIDAILAGTGANNAQLNIDTTAGVVTTGLGNGVYARSDAQSSDGDAGISIVTGDVTSLSTDRYSDIGFVDNTIEPGNAAAVAVGAYGAGTTGASITVDTTAGVLTSGAGHGVYAGNRATSSNGRADLTITTGDVRTGSAFSRGVRASQGATGAQGTDLTIDTTAGTITGDVLRGESDILRAFGGVYAFNTGTSSEGTANSTLVTGDMTTGAGSIVFVSGADAFDDAFFTVDTTAGDILLEDYGSSSVGSVIVGMRAATTATSTTGSADSVVRTGSVTIATDNVGQTTAIQFDSGAVAEGSVDMLLDTTVGTITGDIFVTGQPVTGEDERTSRSGSADITVRTGDVRGLLWIRDEGSIAATSADITVDTTAGATSVDRLGDGEEREVLIDTTAQAGETVDIDGTFGDLMSTRRALRVYHAGSGDAGANITVDTTAGTVRGGSTGIIEFINPVPDYFFAGIDLRHSGSSENGRTDTTLTTASVSGASSGILAVNEARGYAGSDVRIDTTAGSVTGATGDGIYALQSSTSRAGSALLSITTADVTGAGFGIRAVNRAEAAQATDLTIDTTAGDVTGGTGSTGIGAINETANGALRVAAGDVSGGLDGINAQTSGSGGLVVRAAPDGAGIVGTTGSGINAVNTGSGATRIEVARASGAGAVAGALQGLYASHGSAAPFEIDVTAGQVSNLSGQSADRAITARSSGSGVALTIGTGGAVIGTLSLTDADDIVVNDGLWNPTGGITDFGEGTDIVRNTSLNTLVVGNGQPGEVTLFNNLNTFVNSGRVDMADGAASGRLRFGGDFRAEPGSVIEMDIAIGPDGVATDNVTIAGNVSGGATAVRLFPVAGGGGLTGFGPNDGIEMITVEGETKTGDFVLESPVQQDVFVFGNLVLGTDGVWRVQSQYLPSIPTYEVYPSLLLTMLALPSRVERMSRDTATGGGQGSSDGGGSERLPWLRFGGTTLERGAQGSTAQSSFRQSFATVDAGLDFAVSDAEVASLTMHYADGSADVSSPHGAAAFDMQGFGIGAAYSWQGARGVYVDAQARLTVFETDVPGAATEYAVGRAASIEVGRAFDTATGWSITPQAQLTYTGIAFDDFSGDAGETVSLVDGVTVHGRIGLSVERDWENGSAVFATVSLTEALSDGTALDVSVVDTHRFERADSGTALEIGLGGRMAIGENTFVSGSAATSRLYGLSGDSGENRGARLTLGLGMTW